MAITTSSRPDPVREEAKACAHHWLIETPAGSTSPGTYKKCGARRLFSNSLPEQEDYRPVESTDWLALRSGQQA